MQQIFNSRVVFHCSVMLGAVLAVRQKHLRAYVESPNSQSSNGSIMDSNLEGLKQTRTPLGSSAASIMSRPISKVELAVKMHCQSCVKQVRTILERVPGVSKVEIDLERESVVVSGTLASKDLVEALVREGREARVVGTGATSSLVPPEVGLPEEWGAAVGEFKGKIYAHGDVHGVVRIVQVDPETSLVETDVTGLERNKEYSLHVHEYGDLRTVPKTTGKRINNSLLGNGVSDAEGQIKVQKTVSLHVWDIIGRSIVIYREEVPLYGTVIARSAGVGANTGKRLCTCDGTVIW